MGTHEVSGGELVVKRFRSCRRDEPEREWRGLRLLDRYAPGLAPRPVRADLSADPPAVTMTRVPGEALGRTALTGAQLDAVRAALARMHAAVPPAELAGLPPARSARAPLAALAAGFLAGPEPLVAEGVTEPLVCEALVAEPPGAGAPGAGAPVADAAVVDRVVAEAAVVDRVVAEAAVVDRVVAEAAAAAAEWLASGPARAYIGAAGPGPVFGLSDHNLENFLWDGTTVRLVDLEDSGVTDRALELAGVVEHIASRATPDASWAAFLADAELSPAERADLPGARRLHAALWVGLLLPGRPGHSRNPAAVHRAQAERFLALL